MNNTEYIRSNLYELGENIVNCLIQCEGINCDQKNGIIPRCMIFEQEGRNENERGASIVGINPGISKEQERNFYKTGVLRYEKILSYWNNKISRLKYYNSLRNLVNQLGYPGPILWSELVKCENLIKGRLPSMQTFRTCTKKFLHKELELVNKDWPIFAVGKETFKALAFLYPTRIVIGVPHPTGSYGYFTKLFDQNNNLINRITFNELWNGKYGKVIWLKANNE